MVKKIVKPNLDKDKIKNSYESNLPILRVARAELKQLLTDIINNIKDTNLVRARIIDIRIKDLDSILRKLEKKHIGNDKKLYFIRSLNIFDIDDLVGFRIVCNNVEDVYRFSELLKEKMPDGVYIKIQDYIENPKSDGYRALHINFRLDIAKGRKLKKLERIPFEVQVRTLLQDSFARLSHKDIYKSGSSLPSDLQARTVDLADLLTLADNVGSKVRERISELRTPPKKRPKLDNVTKAGLTYIFSKKFGRSPSNYLIQESLNISKKINLVSLSGLQKILNNNNLRKSIDGIYRNVLGVDANQKLFFLASINALVSEKKALDFATSNAKDLKSNIDTRKRKEILNNMPKSYDDFIYELERDNLNITDIAFALYSLQYCESCEAELIKYEELQWAVSEFYNKKDADEKVSSIIISKGIDMPDFDFPAMCNHCAHLYDLGE